ncbi:hypothetical protein llap_10160 [Limosa lapponica baueri]|uniref:Uncharacterized protein n=1 Tax=Limosa lapponica baueri TaxID=1758121 RepID=A0A2I0U0G0_LIMLA|nr:hypothetical protein llap_10160 [Limosa lapponica baueri]
MLSLVEFSKPSTCSEEGISGLLIIWACAGSCNDIYFPVENENKCSKVLKACQGCANFWLSGFRKKYDRNRYLSGDYLENFMENVWKLEDLEIAIVLPQRDVNEKKQQGLGILHLEFAYDANLMPLPIENEAEIFSPVTPVF